jgi:hypothetical protein
MAPVGAALVVSLMTRRTTDAEGLFAEPTALMLIAPVDAPIPSPVLLTDTVNLAGPLPDVGVTLIHGWLALAVQVTVPALLWVSETCCDAEADAPTAPKFRTDEEKASVGPSGFVPGLTPVLEL